MPTTYRHTEHQWKDNSPCAFCLQNSPIETCKVTLSTGAVAGYSWDEKISNVPRCLRCKRRFSLILKLRVLVSVAITAIFVILRLIYGDTFWRSTDPGDWQCYSVVFGISFFLVSGFIHRFFYRRNVYKWLRNYAILTADSESSV
jgi:hypothetical protein